MATKQGGYRDTEIGAIVRLHPDKAKKMLLGAFRQKKGDARAAAESLGISRRTFDRLSIKLDLQKDMAEMRDKFGQS